jgi:prepilin-type N-terminal cleavage/methylation domain-containing protein
MTKRSGFTMVELVVVVVIGVILASIVVDGMDGYPTRSATRQARTVFLSMHARTRAQAAASGLTAKLNVDSDGDSVWISRNDSTLATVQFRAEMGVDIDGEGVDTLCLTPRGFADSSCNSFGQGTMDVRFIQGGHASTVSILPLGQALN